MPVTKEKVLEWLRGEGYPLEYRTLHAFLKAGWRALPGQYARGDDGTPREVDVVAFRDSERRSGLPWARLEYVVECKYSRDKPWILLTSPVCGIAPSAAMAQAITNDLGESACWWLAGDPVLHELDWFRRRESVAFGGVRSLSKGEDAFFNAMRGVVDRAHSMARSYDRRHPNERLGTASVLIQPLLVVDGELYEAAFNEATLELELNAVPFSRVEWSGADSRAVFSCVDVVTSEALDSYLEHKAAHADKLLARMLDAIETFSDALARHDPSLLALSRAPRGMIGMPSLLADMQAAIVREQRYLPKKAGDGEAEEPS